MGKNISIYLDDDTLKWLDQLCKEWGMGRSQAIGYVLTQGKMLVSALVPLLKNKLPKLANDLHEMVKNSE